MKAHTEFELLKPAQAAELTSLSESAFRRVMNTPTGPKSVPIGKRHYFTRQALLHWLASHEIGVSRSLRDAKTRPRFQGEKSLHTAEDWRVLRAKVRKRTREISKPKNQESSGGSST